MRKLLQCSAHVMPMYLYACPTCEAEFERKLSMADCDLPVDCPECGGLAERKPTLFGFVKGNSNAEQNARALQNEMKKKRTHAAGCPCCIPRKSVKKPAVSASSG